MVLFFPLFILACVFGVVLALVPPSLDLVLREVRVRPWFPAPLLVTLLWGLPLLGTAVFWRLDWSHIETVSFIVAMFQYSVAGIMLYLGAALAASRGLQPGGPTRRRRRTSLVAILVLLAITFAGSGWAMVGPPGSELWVFVVPPVGCGVLWVLAVGRRGGERLERGKAVSGGFLVGAALCFWSGTTLVYWTDLLNPYGSTAGFSVLWGLGGWVVAVMVGGLRFVAGRLAAGPLWGALAVSSVSLLPFGLFGLWTPVEDPIPMPRWVDLEGRRSSRPIVLTYAPCITVVGGHTCAGAPDAVAAPSGMRLTEVPPLGHQPLLVDGGRFVANGRWDWSDDQVLSWEDGQPVLDGVRLHWPDELHARLIENQSGMLKVERTFSRTVQDYVSICASHGSECVLRDP